MGVRWRWQVLAQPWFHGDSGRVVFLSYEVPLGERQQRGVGAAGQVCRVDAVVPCPIMDHVHILVCLSSDCHRLVRCVLAIGKMSVFLFRHPVVLGLCIWMLTQSTDSMNVTEDGTLHVWCDEDMHMLRFDSAAVSAAVKDMQDCFDAEVAHVRNERMRLQRPAHG